MFRRTILAVALIVLGVSALAYDRIEYTTRKKVVDAGPIEISTEKRESFPLPPILGVTGIAAGVALLVFGRRD